MLHCISSLLLVLPLLLTVAWYTLVERYVLALVHFRIGPDEWLYGIIQPILDGLKLFIKGRLFVFRSNVLWVIICCSVLLITAMLVYSFLSLDLWYRWDCCEFSLLIIMCITAINSYSMYLVGWLVDNRFSVVGILRFIILFVSFEVAFGLLVVCLLVSVSLFDLSWYWMFVLLLNLSIAAICSWIISLIESGRVPFDLVECESELIAGVMIEYVGGLFALLFLGEYASLICNCAIIFILFISCFDLFGSLATIILLSLISIIGRCLLPRIRIDQLITLVWYGLLWLLFGVIVLGLSEIIVL